MNCPTFSTEVLDLFVDVLADEVSDFKPGSRQALQSCLFVSRSFRKRSRHHLFRVVSLNPSVAGNFPDRHLFARMSLLRQLIGDTATEQSILPLITVFQLFVDDQTYLGSDDFITILARLNSSECRIKRLMFGGYPAHELNWKEMSFACRMGIHTLIRSRALESLLLEGIKEVPSSVLHSTSIKDANLFRLDTRIEEASGMDVDDEAEGLQTSIDLALPLPLVSFAGDVSAAYSLLLKDGVTFADFSLREATLEVGSPNSLAHAAEILQGSYQTLEHLELRFERNSDIFVSPDLELPLQMSVFQRLESLVVIFDPIDHWNTSNNFQNIFSRLVLYVCLLLKASKHHPLAQIDLWFNCHIEYSGKGVVNFDAPDEWSYFDEVLSDSAHSSLREVNVHIVAQNGDAMDEDFFNRNQRCIENSLPRLERSGRLNVEVQ